jgi:hypothetical protein
VDSSSIELAGSQIDAINLEDGILRVSFSRAYISKTMTGSVERTRWYQAGELIIGGAELESDLPLGPLVCAGGDVGENVYTYRDMIPLPLQSRGRVHCDLRAPRKNCLRMARRSCCRCAIRPNTLNMCARPNKSEKPFLVPQQGLGFFKNFKAHARR